MFLTLSQATQKGLCGCSCDSWDSLKDMCHGPCLCPRGHHARACQNTPEHEPGRTCKHISYLCPHTCRMQSRHSAFFALVSFIYSNTPCKITQSCRPISFTPIFSSQSHLPLFQLFTMDKEERDGKKNVFLILPASSSKHKKTGRFSLGSLPVLNQILVKIIDCCPKEAENIYVYQLSLLEVYTMAVWFTGYVPVFPLTLAFPSWADMYPTHMLSVVWLQRNSTATEESTNRHIQITDGK